MGLGKTIQALAWINEHPEALPAVVFCPACLKFVWEDEARQHFGMSSTILSGQTPTRGRLRLRPGLTIINYEIAQYWEDYITHEIRPKTAICDEIHFLSNPETIRSETLQRITEDMPHFIGLSGTPLTNSPEDLYPILNLIRPDLFDSFQRYVWKFTRPKLMPWGWDYKNARNLDELHEILRTKLMIRRLKKDVLKELPPITRSIVPLEITNRRAYDRAAKDYLAYLEETNPAKLKRAKRAPAICRANELRKLVADGKMKGIFAWIDGLLAETDEKLIIFGIHKKPLAALMKRYKKIAVSVRRGGKASSRKDAVRQFQKSKKCRLIIGNIDTMGTGLTLTAARKVAFIELPWVPNKLSQAEARPHRIGQTGNVEIFHLLARDTIDEPMLDLLAYKEKTATATIDGGAEFNIFLGLIKKLQRNPTNGQA